MGQIQGIILLNGCKSSDNSLLTHLIMKNRTISYLAVVACTATLMLLSVVVIAQAPAGINYQAIARDSEGDILANQNISIRFTITDGSAGMVQYVERHQVATNQFGLITLTIGMGTQTSGEFNDITWESISPWLRVEMDPNGGNQYVVLGSSQLMSVPYALYAASSPSSGGLGNGSAPGNTPYWNGTSWIVNSSNIYNNGGDIGINTSAPLGKLHIKGSENISQLIVDGGPTQSNNNPLIKLRRNNGLDLMWIHSNDPSTVFIGVEAGLNNAGTDNTGIGSGALRANTTGSLNTAIGLNSLYRNTTGSNNTAIGIDALLNNVGGENNIAIGNFALNTNLEGDQNAAIGVNALKANTTGNRNSANGANALQKNTSGMSNTSLGFEALLDNTIGSFRTGLGVNSNSAGASFSNNTGVGYNAICSASNQVRIGNSEVTSIGGFADWTNVSDGRFKQNVSENVIGLDFIKALRPVTYTMDLHAIDDWWAENYSLRDSSLAVLGYEGEKIVHTGFVAQEVEATAKALGYEFSGVDAPKNEKDFYGLRYSTFVVPLVKAVQEQQVQIDELKRENAMLRDETAQKLAAQQQQINTLQTILTELTAMPER